MSATKRYWVKWSITGFFMAGSIFTSVAIWGDITWMDHLNIGYRIGMGILSAFSFSSLTGCMAKLYSRCNQKNTFTDSKNLLRQAIHVSNQDYLEEQGCPPVISSYTKYTQPISYGSLSTSCFSMHNHALACNDLVSTYNQKIVNGSVNRKQYQEQADELEEEYRRECPNETNETSDYLILLQANGYLYKKIPSAIMFELPPKSIPKKSQREIPHLSSSCPNDITPPTVAEDVSIVVQSSVEPSIPSSARRHSYT